MVVGVCGFDWVIGREGHDWSVVVWLEVVVLIEGWIHGYLIIAFAVEDAMEEWWSGRVVHCWSGWMGQWCSGGIVGAVMGWYRDAGCSGGMVQ